MRTQDVARTTSWDFSFMEFSLQKKKSAFAEGRILLATVGQFVVVFRSYFGRK